MNIKILVLFTVSCLIAATASAGNGHVTLKKPGSAGKRFIVKNLKFVCNNQVSESFYIEIDGAKTEIPFSAIKKIKLIRYEKPRSSYQLFFKDSSKDRPTLAVKPACNNIKFTGENSFGGGVSIETQFMQSLEFE